jgi:hypothetical protein
MTRGLECCRSRRLGRAMNDPRRLVSEIEACPRLPEGSAERFAGYGVMGLTFGSGHILALRRFPASSVGPGYRSVWHRDPDGRWTFFQDVAPAQGCSRYFGSAVANVSVATIDIDWVGPMQFSVTVTDATRRLDWSVTVTTSPVTRAISQIGSVVPETVWRQRWFVAGMGGLAGPILGAGRISLVGRTPNGQRFVANPLLVWLIAESRATLHGIDLGEIGPAPVPGRMAGFRIPQRGVFAIGQAFFRSQ